MPALPATDQEIRKLRLDSERKRLNLPADAAQVEYRDAKMPGLSLIVGRRAKTWSLTYATASGRRRATLGRYPDVSLADARRDAEAFVMSSDPMLTDPLVGRWKPLRTFKSVVLPAPFGPISPKISPGDTSSETTSRATISPKRTVTAWAERASAFGGAFDAAETKLASLKSVTVGSGIGP